MVLTGEVKEAECGCGGRALNVGPMHLIERLIPWTTASLELAGIAVTLLGAVVATLSAQDYRRQLSQGILLGLEFLVAADIIGTVAVAPSFRSVGVLGLIAAIRSFLSFTLEVEIAGRWPGTIRPE